MVSGPYETILSRMQGFFNKTVKVCPGEVTRGSLIRHQIIQDSDRESNSPAARGIGSILPEQSDATALHFTGNILRRLVGLSCNLITVTITVDEQSFGTLDKLVTSSALRVKTSKPLPRMSITRRVFVSCDYWAMVSSRS